jgi:NADH-ubiquinone oxidoreductase chain 4
MKQIALTTSLINLFVSLFIWFQFDSNTTQFQFVSEFNQLNYCHLNFGIDGISIYFVLLTTFVTPIALLSNYTNINKNLKLFLISFLLLETLQICAFVSLDLLLFYVFFESILPIIFIVIVIFGHGTDRFRSALLLFLYTLAGSLPMLLSILIIFSYVGSTDFQLISLYDISLDSQKILWLSLSFSKRDMTSRIIHKNKNTLNLLERFSKSNKNYLPENKKCKDLVIHGKILRSTINYPRYTSIVRHMVNIPFHLDSIIVGILLSDGHLFINKSGNTLLTLKQKIKNFEFL